MSWLRLMEQKIKEAESAAEGHSAESATEGHAVESAAEGHATGSSIEGPVAGSSIGGPVDQSATEKHKEEANAISGRETHKVQKLIKEMWPAYLIEIFVIILGISITLALEEWRDH